MGDLLKEQEEHHFSQWHPGFIILSDTDLSTYESCIAPKGKMVVDVENNQNGCCYLKRVEVN